MWCSTRCVVHLGDFLLLSLIFVQVWKFSFTVIHLTTIALPAWHKTCLANDFPIHLIPHDVKTCWNSMFDTENGTQIPCSGWYKDVTLFFSQNAISTIAHVIPTMDHIDALLKDITAEPLVPSIKHALTFTYQILDKYYSKTDLSNVYHIAMSKVWPDSYISYLIALLLSSTHTSSLNIFSNRTRRKNRSVWLRRLSGKNSQIITSYTNLPLLMYVWYCLSKILTHQDLISQSWLEIMLIPLTSLTFPWMVLRRWMNLMSTLHSLLRRFTTLLVGGGITEQCFPVFLLWLLTISVYLVSLGSLVINFY